MKEHHKKGRDGKFIDDVDAVFSGRESLSHFDGARSDLRSFGVPVLLHKGAAHERLFFANFDGTGNDAGTDPQHATNVAEFAGDLATTSDSRVASKYLRGPGTHSIKLLQLPDAAWGISNDSRVRQMYRAFAAQADAWLREDPHADVRLMAVGFSRGAEEAAQFTRMVHELGVQVPDGKGMRQVIPPGMIPQAVGLFDPVGIGHPRAHDRHLPASVVSGMQIVARDERRSQFPSTMVIRPGQSDDGRFLGITLPGSHSDIGGSYHSDGLARASRALMADYVNSMSEGGLVRRPQLYSEMTDYDIHLSEKHSVIYTTGAYRRLGERDTRGAEAHPGHCRPVEKCAPPDPVDQLLESRVGPRHAVDVGATPLDVIGREISQRRESTAELPAIREGTSLLGPDVEKPGNRIDFSGFPSLADDRIESSDRGPNDSRSGHGDVAPSLPFSDFDPTSPAHPQHRDNALYQSIHDKLGTIHAEEGITLTDQQMDRLAHCSVATARQCGMTNVTHAALGQDKEGNLQPEVHLYQAFRNDIDDPRTKWGKVDALEAFQTPVQAASQDLQMANQQWDQLAQDQQMRMAQQQEQGMSMSR